MRGLSPKGLSVEQGSGSQVRWKRACASCKGDCLEYLRSVPDGGFTVVVTDPPYGLGDRPGGEQGFLGLGWDVLPGVEIWNVATFSFSQRRERNGERRPDGGVLGHDAGSCACGHSFPQGIPSVGPAVRRGGGVCSVLGTGPYSLPGLRCIGGYGWVGVLHKMPRERGPAAACLSQVSPVWQGALRAVCQGYRHIGQNATMWR